jgi:hypothetical protein
MNEQRTATRPGATAMMGDAVERVEQTVQHWPFSSVATAFGVGLGLGVILGCALSEQSRPSPSHWYDQLSAERLGRNVLDSLSNVLPERLASRIS